MSALAIDRGDIEEARARLAGRVVRTPLLNNPALDAYAVGRGFVKAETLQRTGSFKFRGAMNKLLSLPKAELARGVIATSSGNHAFAVAEAAKILGCAAAIVMPADAPEIKLVDVPAARRRFNSPMRPGGQFAIALIEARLARTRQQSRCSH